ncbi:hypothetical protein HNV08_05630 [Winogradskyella eckloniae]|uniref:hypothetical protein n=1 Tax=Winogradskyella eckloniae TaxID=1089306 RepID=UPI0015636151|nr:hypothetical protein [Winogradskyella eckloniae]NRD19519.1 hypothetical protein [Winogradskyella eckloniae]
MSIIQLQTNQVKAPYLGKPHYPITGLDQLGLNITSERIFECLLPGLNNVTQRIRYYSFYSWFFQWYAAHIGSTSVKQQNSYLRRAEFILALISAHNQKGGVPGITKAQHIYEISDEVIELKKGTQEGDTSVGSYWNNSRGVLGQYYISSVKQLGILADQGSINGLYIRTDFENKTKVSGKKLADAFIENTASNLPVFIKAIEDNSISKLALNDLKTDFDMQLIPNNSNEQKLFWQLFSGVDNPKLKIDTFYRKETIKLVLQSFNDADNNQKYNQLHVPFSLYDKQWDLLSTTTEKLWYLYMMEQFWSVACTSALDIFLLILKDESHDNWIDETKLVDGIIKKLDAVFESESMQPKQDLFITEQFMGFSVPQLIESARKEEDLFDRLGFVLYAIQKLYLENWLHYKSILEFANTFNMHSASSFIVSMADIESKKQLTISDFSHYFLTRYIINRHYYVALRKLSATQNSAKFYREEGQIRYVDKFIYGYSSPRIHTLVDFLKDLNLIHKDKTELTELGQLKLEALSI